MTLRIIQRPFPGLGMLFQPPGDGPFPAVLMLHGSEGSWSLHSHLGAAMLAAHGVAALPLGYSVRGNPWNTGDIRDIPLDRTAAALDNLRSSPFCRGHVGLYGVSRGAEHALLLASLMARDGVDSQADAVAILSPPDVVIGATERDRGDVGWRVYDGAARAWTWRGSSDGLLPTTPIEVERYGGPMLIAQGTEDDVCPPR